ncbi:hypothetical protein ACIQZO_37650 [Streptomyces sp. NPDC097617]|uniref:hypothetical protein n=1 Tax=Streptomyces sp. NPDC097617 TaxID=3366091 RepID=UPI00380D82C5
MNQIREQGVPALLGAHLPRLQDDTSWKKASGSATVGRPVDATLNSLTTSLSEPAAPASRGPGLRGGGPLPLHYDTRRCGPRAAGPDGSRGPRSGSRPDRPEERGVTP